MFKKLYVPVCITILFVGVAYLCFQNQEAIGLKQIIESDKIYVKNVVSIYDGDTFTVNLSEKEFQHKVFYHRIGVRIRGIDCPEMTDKRTEILEKARLAKQFTVNKLRNSKNIVLRNPSRDKYFRILADVEIDGQNLSDMLIKEGLAKKYDGGKKESW